MELATKPNFRETKERWRAFWSREVLDRPICLITGPRFGMNPPERPPYMAEAIEDPVRVAEGVCAAAEGRFWLGEAIPEETRRSGPISTQLSLGANWSVHLMPSPPVGRCP